MNKLESKRFMGDGKVFAIIYFAYDLFENLHLYILDCILLLYYINIIFILIVLLFLIEKVPLLYTFHRKWYPLDIPTERLLLNFQYE